MQKDPSTNAPNGRDTSGRFAEGNRLGKGNPLAGQVHLRRQTFYSAVSEADLIAIVGAVVEKAKRGDIAAAKVILEWTIGRPGALAQLDGGGSWLDSLGSM